MKRQKREMKNISSKASGLFLVLAALVSFVIPRTSYGACGATTYTWIETKRSDWSDTTYWSPAGIPDSSTENAVLSSSNSTDMLNGTISCFDASSGILNSDRNAVLTIVGDYFRATTSGSLNFKAADSAKILMAGTNNQTYEANGTVTNLEISNNALVEIKNPGTVADTLTLSGSSTIVEVEPAGTWTIGSALTIPAGVTVKVMSGATLRLNAGVTVNGTLSVQGGGRLMIPSGQTLAVGAGGTLNLNGSSGNSASVVTDGANRYFTLTMSGTLNANYFRIEGLSGNGVDVTGGTITTLQNGEFRNADTGTSYITLSATATIPATMDGLGFYDDYAFGNLTNINASAFSASSVTLDNYSGDIAGATFENDPNAVITWATTAATTLSVSNSSAANQPGTNIANSDGELVFAILNFSLSAVDTATDITSLKLTLDGTGTSADLQFVRIYQDTNANCLFDSGTDTQIGTDQTLSGSPATTTFSIPATTVQTSGPSDQACVIVTGQISTTAGDGNTVALGVEATADITNSQAYSFSTGSAPPVYGNFGDIFTGTTSSWTGTQSNLYTEQKNWDGKAPDQTNALNCDIGNGTNVTLLNVTPAYCQNANLLSSGTMDWNSTTNVFLVTGSLSVASGFTFSNATSGQITMGGTTAQTMTMTEAFPGNVVIDNTGNTITVNGNSTISGNLTITNGNLSIATGVNLTVNGNVTVQTGGTLTLGGNSTLTLGNGSTLTIDSGGQLTLVGTSGNTALITTGSTSNSYSVIVNGTIEARYYTFKHLSSAGVSIEAGATINATNHLQDGTFTEPVQSNGTLLVLKQQIPGNTLSNMNFSTGALSATNVKNIDTTGAAAGTLTVNTYVGDLAGPTFDIDPTYLIDWLGASNTLIVDANATAATSAPQGSTVNMGSFSFVQSQAGASYNNTDITSLTLTLVGTANSSDIDAVRIYNDIDCDQAGGTLIGTGTYSGNPATVTFTINPGDFTVQSDIATPPTICLYVEYDISPTATAAATAGASIDSATDITNSEGYSIDPTSTFPIGLGTSTITAVTSSTWTGGTSTDWFTASNWSDGVPSATVDCIIDAGTFDPTIGSGTAACDEVTINAGGSVTLSAGATWQISNNFTNNGTFSQTGTLEFADTLGITQVVSSVSTLTNVNINQNVASLFEISGSVTINNLTIASNSTINVPNGSTLILPNGFSWSTGILQLKGGGRIEVGSGNSLSMSGGTFRAQGSNTTWPQTLSVMGTITAQGETGTWGFNTTGGVVAIQGLLLKRLNTSGLVLGGTTGVSQISSIQFSNLSTSYASVQALQLNTTGALPTAVTNIYWTWGDPNFEGTDSNSDGIPDAPTPDSADTYLLASSTGCNSQTVDLNNWTGDWFETPTTFDVSTKVSATGCTINMNSAQSAVSLEYLKAEPYDGAVDVKWSTKTEQNHLGFNVYRAKENGSEFTKVNDYLILNYNSSGLNRGTYRFIDSDVTNGETYFYYIEDVETDGITSELHGPVAATPQSGLGAPPSTGSGVNDGTNPSDGENDTTEPGTIKNPSYRDLGDGVVIISQTSTNLRLKVTPLSFATSTAAWDSSYQTLSAHGFGKTTTPGHPELLERTLLLKVNSFITQASVANKTVTASPNNGLKVSPAPHYTANGSGILEASYNPDTTAYSSTAFSPSDYISVDSSPVTVAGEKFIKVSLYPFLYKAGTQEGNLLSELVVDISLDEGTWQQPPVADYNVRAPSAVANTLRIFVPQEGLYQLKYSDLTATDTEGPFANISLSELRLFFKETEIPLYIYDSNSDGQFNGADTLYFYSPYEESLDENYQVLALASRDILDSGDSPKRMSFSDGTPSQGLSNFSLGLYSTEVEENTEYFTEVPIGDEQDHFFAARLFSYSGLDTYDFTANLTNLAPGYSGSLVEIKVHLKANLTWFGEGLNSNLELYINDMTLPLSDVTYQGNSRMTVTFKLDHSDFVAGTNSFRLRSTGAYLSGDYEFSYIDKIEFEYVGNLKANSDKLGPVKVENGFHYDIPGFTTQNLFVLDVSNKLDPKPYSNVSSYSPDSGATYNLDFYVDPENSEDYLSNILIRPFSGIDSVSFLQLTPGYYQSLKSSDNQYDYVVIGSDYLMTAAKKLIQHREAQGLRVLTVTLDQIYAEFAHGKRSTAAIQKFLQTMKDSWAFPKPKYILFLGDGTFNPKSYELISEFDYDPITDDEKASKNLSTWPLKIRPGVFWDFGDDHFFNTKSGDETPLFAIGRLPFNSAVDIANYALKVIAYETGTASPEEVGLSQAVFFSDKDQDNEKFEQRVSSIADLETWNNASMTTTTYSHGQLTAASMVTELNQAFNQAPLLLSFYGHGASNQFGSNLYNLNHVNALSNTHYPIFMALNCDNAYYYNEDIDEISIGERLIANKNGGAIAFLGSTTWSTPTAQDKLGRAFYSQLTSSLAAGRYEDRLGIILQKAKAEIASDRYARDVIRSFTLFGDPALKLPTESFTPPPIKVTPPPSAAEESGGGCSLGAADGSKIPWTHGMMEWLLYLFTLVFIRKVWSKPFKSKDSK